MSDTSLLHRLAMLGEQTYDAIRSRVRHHVKDDDPVRVEPFRGWANATTTRFQGRVLRDPDFAEEAQEEMGPIDNLISILRRYASDEVAGARVRVRFGEHEEEVETDAEGYLKLELATPRGLDPERLWHPVTCALLEPLGPGQEATRFEGYVQYPQRASLGIISDLDDTVVRTGASSLLRHARTVMFNNATTRTPFAGVSELYSALQADINPLWYVSSSPWNLHGLFERFMKTHEIPPGSIVLKDFGFDEHKFIRGGHLEHKRAHIERVMDDFPQLPFVLIGDSGQRDPEIYAALARERGAQLAAVYIRDVTPQARDAEVDALIEEAAAHDVPMLRVRDSLAAAEHAAEQGWIDGAALARVREVTQEEARR